MYNVQLGHQGQCDKRAVTSGGGDCCDTIQSQVTGLTSDVNTLKSQVSVTNATPRNKCPKSTNIGKKKEKKEKRKKKRKEKKKKRCLKQ